MTTTCRVSIVRRNDALADEAVASEKIEAGTVVVDEAPILILPHQDILFSSSSSSSSTADSSAQQNQTRIQEEGHNQHQPETATVSRFHSLLSQHPDALAEFTHLVEPALRLAEAIAQQHRLKPAAGFFAPLIMAHFTRSKSEIRELFSWLISHVDLYQNNSKNVISSSGFELARGNSRQVGFGPQKLTEAEVAATSALLERLPEVLGENETNANQNEQQNERPTVAFWMNELLIDKNNNNNSNRRRNQNQTSKREVLFVAAVLLLRWLHAVRINVHADDVNKLTAVFKSPCKFNHSCKPNTFWFLTSSSSSRQTPTTTTAAGGGAASSSPSSGGGGGGAAVASENENASPNAAAAPDGAIILPALRRTLHAVIGHAVHIATRDIAANEPTTFSYVGCGLNLLSPAPQRRHTLSHLNFVCACERCADYDAGRKPELALRALVCGECLVNANDERKVQYEQQVARMQQQQQQNQNRQEASSSSSSALSPAPQQQPPPPPPPLPTSEFVTVVLHPTQGGWQCQRCRFRPAYGDIAESLLHEAVHVEMVMKGFFVKKMISSSSSSRLASPRVTTTTTVGEEQHHVDPQQQLHQEEEETTTTTETTRRDLHELFSIIQRVGRQLTFRHYIAAVAITSFVGQLVTHINKQYYSFEKLKTDVFTSKSVADEFVKAVTQTIVWYQATMRGSPQHVRFLISTSELILLCQQQNQEGGESFLEPSHVDMLSALTSSFSSSAAFERLKVFPDMTC